VIEHSLPGDDFSSPPSCRQSFDKSDSDRAGQRVFDANSERVPKAGHEDAMASEVLIFGSGPGDFYARGPHIGSLVAAGVEGGGPRGMQERKLALREADGCFRCRGRLAVRRKGLVSAARRDESGLVRAGPR